MPLFEMVKTCVFGVPFGSMPKFNGEGATVIFGLPPAPVSEAIAVLPGMALPGMALMESVAESCRTAVGVYETVMMHVEPAIKTVPLHVVLEWVWKLPGLAPVSW
jgi:hypothetical protein